MPSDYYKKCKELDECTRIMEKHWEKKEYREVFEGHLPLAEGGYPLAECQVGWFYYEGIGTEIDYEKALFWTRRGAQHGDRDCQYNLYSMFFKEGIGDVSMEEALLNLQFAQDQKHDLASKALEELKSL